MKFFIILILVCLPFLIKGQVAIPSNYGIVTNNRSVDNSSALTQMFTDAANGLITAFEFNGEINIDNIVYPPSGIDGFTFRSATTGTRATIFSDNLENLIVFSFVDVDNINWIDIKFETTHSDASSFSQSKNESSLLFYRFSKGDNWYHQNVEFTSPNVRTNGAKIYVQSSQMGGSDQTFITNVDFVNCYWHDIGRFAIEIFGQWNFDYNNPSPITVTNFLIRDIEFTGCTVDNVIAGLAFSLVNGLENIRVNNNVFNNSGSALELAGQNAHFNNNTVTGDDSGFQLGSTYTGTPGTNINVWWATNDVHIYDNTFDLNDNAQINGARNVVIENNNFIKLPRLFLSEGDSIEIKNNDINFIGVAGVAIRQQDADPFGDLNFSNNNITLVNDINFFTGDANVVMNCNNVYVINTNNYPVGVDVQTNVSKYLNGNFVQEYGDNGLSCGTIGLGAPTTSCTNDISNEYNSIVLSSSGLVSGLDNILGTSTNVNSSACAIELHNTNSNEPFSRIEKSINLASNSLLAGDLLEIRLDGNNNTGLARLELVQDNTPNTSLSSNTYTGSGWQTYVDTIVIPSGIITLDLWLYSNYNTNTPGVTFYDNLYVRKIDTTNCPDYLPNEDLVITLPQGALSSGLDSVKGTSLITNGSSCALEVINSDNNQLFSRYHIPVVLANYGLNTGDLIAFSLDGNNHTGAARIEIVTDNTPNTAVSFYSFVGSGWDSFSDTFTIPSGITSLDLWFFSNYNTAIPGTAVYDNLVLRKLNTTGLQENKINELTVYPNPTNNNVFIKSEKTLTKVELYNSLGELVLTQQVNSKQLTVNLNKFPKGIYSLKVFDKNNTLTKQIIKL